MHELDRSRVGPQEIDSLGHLNVRFYLARVDRASAVLLDALGLSAGALDARGAKLRRVDTYCRFRANSSKAPSSAYTAGCSPVPVRRFRLFRDPQSVEGRARGHVRDRDDPCRPHQPADAGAARLGPVGQ